MAAASLNQLLQEIQRCTLCADHLPLGPRPVVSAAPNARILIIGQAPGTKVHASGIPWDDASGRRLRQWMDLSDEQFYDPQQIAIIPMGFCYPGRGKSGDLPPRPECAPRWHQSLLDQLPQLRLTLLIGQYAQKYYLGRRRQRNLTETVMAFEDYLPEFFPLVHPSPRNGIWLRKHPWFEEAVVPALQGRVREVLGT